MHLCEHVFMCVHTQLCREMYVLQVSVRGMWILSDEVYYLLNYFIYR